MSYIYHTRKDADQPRYFVTKPDGQGYTTLIVHEVQTFDDELTALNALGVVSSLFHARQLIKAVCAPKGEAND